MWSPSTLPLWSIAAVASLLGNVSSVVAATTTAVPNSTPDDKEDDDFIDTVGFIVMVAVAAPVVGLLLVLIAVCCCRRYRRRQRQRRRPSFAKDVEDVPMSLQALGQPASRAPLLEQWVPAHANGFVHPPSTEKELLDELGASLVTRIADHQLTIMQSLGSGSFGEVYSALYRAYEGQDPPQTVAVKALATSAPDQAQARLKLLQEAAIMGQFRHPKVIALLGLVVKQQDHDTPTSASDKDSQLPSRASGSTGMLASPSDDLPSPLTDVPKLVCEYMHRGPLDRLLRRANPEPDVLQRMSVDVAEGVHYLSCCRFVLGDFTARHVMVDADYTCKIGGFGLSRDLADASDVAQLIRLRWVPPELFPTASDSIQLPIQTQMHVIAVKPEHEPTQSRQRNSSSRKGPASNASDEKIHVQDGAETHIRSLEQETIVVEHVENTAHHAAGEAVITPSQERHVATSAAVIETDVRQSVLSQDSGVAEATAMATSQEHPESSADAVCRCFTQKTDVWCLGVVLWEIWSRGELPYGRWPDREVIRNVCLGHRLAPPQLCSKDMYEVMMQTWHPQPDQRPDMASVLKAVRSCKVLDTPPGTGTRYDELENMYVAGPDMTRDEKQNPASPASAVGHQLDFAAQAESEVDAAFSTFDSLVSPASSQRLGDTKRPARPGLASLLLSPSDSARSTMTSKAASNLSRTPESDRRALPRQQPEFLSVFEPKDGSARGRTKSPLVPKAAAAEDSYITIVPGQPTNTVPRVRSQLSHQNSAESDASDKSAVSAITPGSLSVLRSTHDQSVRKQRFKRTFSAPLNPDDSSDDTLAQRSRDSSAEGSSSGKYLSVSGAERAGAFSSKRAISLPADTQDATGFAQRSTPASFSFLQQRNAARAHSPGHRVARKSASVDETSTPLADHHTSETTRTIDDASHDSASKKQLPVTAMSLALKGVPPEAALPAEQQQSGVFVPEPDGDSSSGSTSATAISPNENDTRVSGATPTASRTDSTMRDRDVSNGSDGGVLGRVAQRRSLFRRQNAVSTDNDPQRLSRAAYSPPPGYLPGMSA